MDAKTRFQQFDRENPIIFRWFERISIHEAKHAKRLSAKAIYEQIRGKFPDFLNNDFTPFYARKFLSKHRSYAGLFELRTQRSVSK